MRHRLFVLGVLTALLGSSACVGPPVSGPRDSLQLLDCPGLINMGGTLRDGNAAGYDTPGEAAEEVRLELIAAGLAESDVTFLATGARTFLWTRPDIDPPKGRGLVTVERVPAGGFLATLVAFCEEDIPSGFAWGAEG